MRISICLFLLLVFSGKDYGQIVTFIQSIGVENVQEDITQLVVTSNNDYFITGGISSALWYAKIDTLGELIWDQFYNGDHGAFGAAAVETSDHGFLIGGEQKLEDLFGRGFADALVVKTNDFGDTIWTFTWNSEDYDSRAEIRSIHETTNSNYLVTGNTNAEFNANLSRAFSLLLDQNGNEIWTKIYDDPTFVVRSTSTRDGGYLLGGIYGYPYTTLTSSFLAKISSNGDTLWTKINHLDIPHSAITGIVEASDNSIMVSGNAVLEDLSEVAFMSKLDHTGNLLWTRFYTAVEKTNSAILITNLADNEYTFTGNNGNNVWLVNLAVNGDTLWTQTYNLEGQQIARDVKLCPDGGFIISATDKTKLDVLLIKTDSLGRVDFTTSLTASSLSKGGNIRIFPNPALNTIYVEIPQDNSRNNSLLTYTISNSSGQLIDTRQTYASSPLLEINISTLSSGLYLLSIKEGKHTYHRKFLKQ